jgi:hypothetical protein
MRYPSAMCLLVTALLTGCDRLWPDVAWRAGHYVAIDIDSREQMSVSYDLEDGGAIGRVPATVFAVGSDGRYLIIKQHPYDSIGKWEKIDRSVTNYYIIDSTKDSKFADPSPPVVIGPLSETEFQKKKIELKLPEFQKIFSDLE